MSNQISQIWSLSKPSHRWEAQYCIVFPSCFAAPQRRNGEQLRVLYWARAPSGSPFRMSDSRIDQMESVLWGAQCDYSRASTTIPDLGESKEHKSQPTSPNDDELSRESKLLKCLKYELAHHARVGNCEAHGHKCVPSKAQLQYVSRLVLRTFAGITRVYLPVDISYFFNLMLACNNA